MDYVNNVLLISNDSKVISFCNSACDSLYSLEVATSVSNKLFLSSAFATVVVDTGFSHAQEVLQNIPNHAHLVLLSRVNKCHCYSENNCIPFPCDIDIFRKALNSCPLKSRSLKPDANMLKQTAETYSSKSQDKLHGFEKLTGSSTEIITIKKQLAYIAPTELNVLLLGESGTGKTLVAELIHKHSARKKKKFVCKNMAAIAENLVESELFGTVPGAYTGACKRQGMFALANEGTLFMDEIAEISTNIQSKLLRVLESGFYSSVGSDVEYKTNVRLISATNANLFQLTESKIFRKDLYYRIADYILVMPTLRERKNDIKEIADRILLSQNKILSNFALEKMMNYHWPGNVRQLISCLRRAAVLSPSETIQAEAISFCSA